MVWLDLALWLAITLAALAGPRVMRRHTVRAPGPGEGCAPISVIVAVRNEAPRVARLVATLLRQDHPNMQVVIVDDRSTDGTAKVARQMAGGDPRFQFLRVDRRPQGWQGRLHALGTGVRLAEHNWLLFLSGDQELTSASFLRSMVAEYERSGAAAVSVIGPFGGNGWWHRYWFHPMMNNPMFWGLVLFFRDLLPRSSWLMGAIGMQRALYEELGGVAAAATCAGGAYDDWGWARVFEARREPTRMAYHPALLDHSNWTDFATFRDGFVRWQVGIFTYRSGGWLAAVAIAVGFLAVTWRLAVGCLGLTGSLALEPSAVVLLTAVPIAGLGYCAWTGERLRLAWLFLLVPAEVVVSIAWAIAARLRNRVRWRDETIQAVVSSPVGRATASNRD